MKYSIQLFCVSSIGNDEERLCVTQPVSPELLKACSAKIINVVCTCSQIAGLDRNVVASYDISITFLNNVVFSPGSGVSIL